MLNNREMAMFESVARGNPALREWLVAELEKQVSVLIKVVDSELMRRAQGHAQCLQNLIDNLDAHKQVPRASGLST